LRTVVNDGASIGANATILPTLVLGKYSMVGAGSVEIRDAPLFTVVVGNLFRILRETGPT
jgi:acetyltransferase-like isoleucine patch superfamily enzyme